MTILVAAGCEPQTLVVAARVLQSPPSSTEPSAMSSRTIEISVEQAALLDEIVETGLYADPAAAFDAALQALHSRVVERDAALRREIARGVTGLEAGLLTESEEEDLDQFLDGWALLAEATPPRAKGP